MTGKATRLESSRREDLVSRRQILARIVAVSLACTGTACTASDKTKEGDGHRPSVSPTGLPTTIVAKPTKRLRVTSFGAVGDGVTDDTAALERAFATVRPGEAVVLPAGGSFVHRKVLSITTPGVFLLGPGTLNATVEAASAVKIEAPRVFIDGVRFAMHNTTKRWSTPDQHKLFIGPVDGVTVQNIDITGSAAAGLFCFGPSNFALRHVAVSDTRADGIHMTGGSSHGTIDSAVIRRSADDGVAVVSYLDDPNTCSDIQVANVAVQTTTGGRGVSVVGGTRIGYQNVNIRDSFAASVYVACEGGSSITRPVSDVTVEDGVIYGANTSTDIDHGAVLIYSGRSGGYVRNVVVSGLRISDTRRTASRQIGVVADNHDPVSGVVFRDLTLDSTPMPYQGDGSSASFTLAHVIAHGHVVTKGS